MGSQMCSVQILLGIRPFLGDSVGAALIRRFVLVLRLAALVRVHLECVIAVAGNCCCQNHGVNGTCQRYQIALLPLRDLISTRREAPRSLK
jgi:hypothetical protein